MSYEKAKFINFDDFYRNRKIIRTLYEELELRDKIAFKRFVYDELKECETDKDCIWNFLNKNENCKKELIARMNTIMNSRKKVHNLYEMIEESDKIKELEKIRSDIFDMI